MNWGKGSDTQEKSVQNTVYGDRCENCGGSMIPREGKRFCRPSCKDAYHRKAHTVGKQKMKSKGIHYAKLYNSPRLQRLLKFLSDGKKHTTKEINRGADIQAVNTAVDELRENGFDIPCKLREIKEDRSKIYEYQLCKHEVAT